MKYKSNLSITFNEIKYEYDRNPTDNLKVKRNHITAFNTDILNVEIWLTPFMYAILLILKK